MAYQNGVNSGSYPLEGVVEEATFRLILDGVTEMLVDVWRSDDERKKVTKQLLLKWHPDKNPACDRELATAVTQHIQMELRRLEEGQPRPGASYASYHTDPRNPFSGSETFQRRYQEAYEFYSELLRNRKKQYEQQQSERMNNTFPKSPSDPNFSRGRTPMYANRKRETFGASDQDASATSDRANKEAPSGGEHPRSTPAAGGHQHSTPTAGEHSRSTPAAGGHQHSTPTAGEHPRSTPAAGGHQRTTPGPREPLRNPYAGRTSESTFRYPEEMKNVSQVDLEKAKKLLVQATHDISSAENDYDTANPAYEWACFKSQQAVEKALKATHLAQSGYKSISHDIESLTATLPDDELKRLSKLIKKTLGDMKKFYNLAETDVETLPHEEFSKETACNVMMWARDIIQRSKELVDTFIIHHEFS